MKVFSILGAKHPQIGATIKAGCCQVKPTKQSSKNPEPIPVSHGKALILLQLTTGYSDKQALKTYQYYWNKYPDVWKTTKVVNTNIDINDPNKTLLTTPEIIKNEINILSYYYKLGYTLFIGFTTSDILAGCLPWFNQHPNALGISLTSSSPALAFPKPVYRLQPVDSDILQPLIPIADKSPQILYFYSKNQNASEALKITLENLYGDKLYLYAVEDNSSNINELQITQFYNSIPGGLQSNATTIIYLYVGDQLENYINVYSENFKMPNNNYDISVNPVNINENTKAGIVNKYFVLNFYSLSTSLMFRQGIEYLKLDFSSAVPNALILQNFLIDYGKNQIDTISSENDILEFNENNDLKYFSVLTYVYTDINNVYSYQKVSLYINNPLAAGITIYY
jgi:hypothetical protein